MRNAVAPNVAVSRGDFWVAGAGFIALAIYIGIERPAASPIAIFRPIVPALSVGLILFAVLPPAQAYLGNGVVILGGYCVDIAIMLVSADLAFRAKRSVALFFFLLHPGVAAGHHCRLGLRGRDGAGRRSGAGRPDVAFGHVRHPGDRGGHAGVLPKRPAALLPAATHRATQPGPGGALCGRGGAVRHHGARDRSSGAAGQRQERALPMQGALHSRKQPRATT